MDTSLKRIIAFVIDIVIISLIFRVVSILPIDPYKEKYNETYKKYTEVVEDNKEVSDENKDEIIELNYEVYKYRTYSSIISASIFVLYFGVLQYALKGQTVGKKLMKIKVESSNDKKVTIWKYILRIIVLNNIWLSLLNTGAVYIFKDVNFYYVTYVISMISSLLYMMNLIMIMFRNDNRGIHDFVAGTKVVETNVTSVEIEPIEKDKKETVKEKAEKKAKKSKK
mgnify:FL=1